MSSPQRQICSRRDRTFRRRCRLNSPACCSRQARYYRHFTCRRRLPLAARLTFLGSRDCSTQRGHPAVADKALTDRQIKGFTCPHIGTGKTFNLLCSTMLSATARVSWLSPCRGGSICLLSGQRRVSPAKRLRNTVLSVEMPFYRTYCHVSLPAFSPISVMTSWPAWAAMAGGHNRRGTQGGGRSRPTQLGCGQRQPLTTESGGLLRQNIRLTRNCNWNCAGFCKIGKRLPEGPHKRRGGAAASLRSE